MQAYLHHVYAAFRIVNDENVLNVQFKGDLHSTLLHVRAESYAMRILNPVVCILLCNISALSLNMEEYYRFFILCCVL